jgi:hypothetical protein
MREVIRKFHIKNMVVEFLLLKENTMPGKAYEIANVAYGDLVRNNKTKGLYCVISKDQAFKKVFSMIKRTEDDCIFLIKDGRVSVVPRPEKFNDTYSIVLRKKNDRPVNLIQPTKRG